MKKETVLTLDVEDLGTNLFINNIEFSLVNSTGIYASMNIDFLEKFKKAASIKLNKKVFIEADFYSNDKIEPLGGVDSPQFCLLLCSDTQKSDSESYFTEAEDYGEIVLHQVKLSKKLVMVLETYLLVQMFVKLGITETYSDNEKPTPNMTSEMIECYIRRYLFTNNFDVLKNFDGHSEIHIAFPDRI